MESSATNCFSATRLSGRHLRYSCTSPPTSLLYTISLPLGLLIRGVGLYRESVLEKHRIPCMPIGQSRVQISKSLIKQGENTLKHKWPRNGVIMTYHNGHRISAETIASILYRRWVFSHSWFCHGECGYAGYIDRGIMS